MPWFPNPSGGAPIQAATNPNPAGGTLGFYSDPSYTGPPPAGASGSTVAAAAPSSTVAAPQSQQLASGINSLLGAISSGNKQAFDEAVRQFNATFGLDQQKFQESIRQYNEGLAVTQAGLTGQYQGQQTMQGQQQGFNQAQAVAQMTGYWNPSAPGTWGGGGYFVGSDGRVHQGSPSGPAWSTTGTDPKGSAANPSWPTGSQVSDPYQLLQPVPAGGPPSVQAAAQGTPTLQAQQQWASLFGTNAPPTAGQQTLANIAQQNQIKQNWAQQFGYVPQLDANGQPIFQNVPGGGPATTLAAQEQTYRQQLDAINAAAALQANPFRQQQVLGQLGRVLGGQGVAGFAAPNTVQGVGTAGGTGPNTGMAYMQQMIDDIRNPGANQASVNSVLEGIPTPNKINSADFLRAAPSTQQMILQGMQEKYGLDPSDSLQQIKNTLPSFNAPTTFGTIKG